MRNKKVLAISFVMAFVLAFLIYCKAQTAYKEDPKQKEMEIYLKTAKIISINKNDIAGRTAPWDINLDDGKIKRRARFKHLDRHRPSILADSYKYEIAAYELDKLLNLNIVPPVVEREIEGIKGSLQIFIEDCIPESERKRRGMAPPDRKRYKDNLEEINVFENLVHDEECFDQDDTLIHVEDWKVCRVDFSMAFSPVSDLIPGCQITRCSKKLYQNLSDLEHRTVKAALKSYLNEDEIEALLKRKNIIIEKIKNLIEEKGKDSILF